MVTKHIKVIEVIINGNGKKGNKATGIKYPVMKQILDISYKKIPNYIIKIIEMKRAEKCIRINNDS